MSKVTTYSYKLGNDNGNANHDIFINNEFYTQENVNKVLYEDDKRGYKNISTNTALEEIMDRIVATITSPSITANTYLVGKSALSGGKNQPNEITVGFDLKSESPIPVINTLGLVAAYSVKKHYEKTKATPENNDVINVEIEMNTALPIREYYVNQTNKEVFTNKFLNGPHIVVVHLGEVNVTVNVKFTRVYVTPEASSVYWFLAEVATKEEVANEIFAEFMREYELDTVNAKQISESRILHLDIGSGTTELPLTNPLPDPEFITGKNIGIGHAIDTIVEDFGDEIGIPDLTRLEFDLILKKKKNSQFYSKAYNKIEPHLRKQADDIIKQLKKELRKAQMDVDYILVYGGGSVLLKKFLYDAIKDVAKVTEKAKLIYVPAKYAVKLNAYGLNAFVHHEVFEYKTEDQVAVDAETVES